MTKADIIDILDGTHEKHGRVVALFLHVLILLSAISISLETVETLPGWFHIALLRFEIIVLAVFVTEYILRVTCSPRPLEYVFSFWGIVDLFACLPAMAIIQSNWQVVRTIRLIRLVRLLKLFRTSTAFDRLLQAFATVRGELLIFIILSGLILYVAAVGIYLFEHEAQPDVFASIPMSLWWAVASLTTVGYGDMFPITPGGRVFTTFILFIGLGVVAVPAAIITTALMNTRKAEKTFKKKKKKNRKPRKSAKEPLSAKTTKQGKPK
jgi:voltage-gated potassium channel